MTYQPTPQELLLEFEAAVLLDERLSVAANEGYLVSHDSLVTASERVEALRGKLIDLLSR
jgi:hypothetical protein